MTAATAWKYNHIAPAVRASHNSVKWAVFAAWEDEL
jgi:hypothetical protein